MGVDTKGVVLTPYKDVLVIAALVERAVTKVVNEEREMMFPGAHRWTKAVQEQFTSPDINLRPESGMLNVDFRFRGEGRSLKVFVTCDCDHKDLAPKSISLLIGCWGSSDIIMQTALHALSLLGPAYFDHNDCDDIDMAPLQEIRPNLMESVRLGYVSDIYLDDWHERLPALSLHTSAMRRQFLGCTEKAYLDACGVPEGEARQKAVKALVAKTPIPRVTFLEEYHQTMAATESLAAEPKFVAPLRKHRAAKAAAIAAV